MLVGIGAVVVLGDGIGGLAARRDHLIKGTHIHIFPLAQYTV